MPPQSVRTPAAIAFRLFFWAGVAAFFSNCALVAPAPAQKATLVNPEEERYFELADKVTQQQAQIAKLTATVEALKTKAAPAKSTAGKAKKPASPKTSELEIFTTDEDPLAPLEESTVVDSKHETMHNYFAGLSRMEEGKYDLALTSFRDFLKQNPNHVYADRAEYQIAEAHFMNKEYGLAVVTTNLLETRYPYSFRLPESIYKRALSYENMGQSESARDALRDLLKKYPESNVAKLASQKLGELPKSGDAAPPLLQ